MDIIAMLNTQALSARLFILDDEALVFDQPSQHLYRLDRAAALIWCCLADGLGRQDTALRLAEAGSLSHAQAEALVDDAIETWTARGLVKHSPEGLRQFRHRARRARRSLQHKRPALSFNIAGLDVRLHCDAPRCARRVFAAFAHLPPRRGIGRTVMIDVRARPPGAHVFCDGARIANVESADGLAPALKAALAQRVLEQDDYRLAVHAAALSRKGRVVLIPGEAGIGKSTLAAALMARGFTLLGDDTLLLEWDLRVRPVPFAPAIKAGAWGMLAGLYPTLRDVPVDIRPDGKAVRYLRPGAIARESLPMAWLLFPDRRSNAEPRLSPLSRSEALRRLLACCYTPARALSRDDVARLVDWIAAIECATLASGDLPAALDAIDRLCR